MYTQICEVMQTCTRKSMMSTKTIIMGGEGGIW